jgi:hypothetical protein
VRVTEVALLCGIVVAGCLVRFVHLGTSSLWWDELVHVRTAQQPGWLAVFRAVKEGVPPGSDNAAAVPLDYLLLHAWLRLVPEPSPAWLEVYYRAPAALYSCLALVAMWAFCRTTFGLAVAAVATALLAVSMPHVLYAAEARFYALLVLMTILNLWAFARLLDAPGSFRRWLVWGVASTATMAAGLYGVFLLGAEFAVLSVVGARTGRRAVVAMVVCGVVLAALLAAYFAATSLDVIYPRGYPAGLRTWGAIRDTATFFALDSPLLAWVFILGVPLALLDAALHGRRRLPLLIALVLTVLAIPLIVQIARWKHYYYHPRHAFFLLPIVHVTTALALVAVLRRLVREHAGWTTALGLAVVLAVCGPIAYRYLLDPSAFFGLVKIDRDFRGFAQDLSGRLAHAPPGSQHLVLVERNRPGYLGNPLLDFYLRAYGLADRVVLRGFSDPAAVTRLAATCADGCRGRQDGRLESTLGAGTPFGQAPQMRELIELREPMGTWPAHLEGVSLVLYSAFFGEAPVPGLRRRPYRGFVVFEPLS